MNVEGAQWKDRVVGSVRKGGNGYSPTHVTNKLYRKATLKVSTMVGLSRPTPLGKLIVVVQGQEDSKDVRNSLINYVTILTVASRGI